MRETEIDKIGARKRAIREVQGSIEGNNGGLDADNNNALAQPPGRWCETEEFLRCATPRLETCAREDQHAFHAPF